MILSVKQTVLLMEQIDLLYFELNEHYPFFETPCRHLDMQLLVTLSPQRQQVILVREKTRQQPHLTTTATSPATTASPSTAFKYILHLFELVQLILLSNVLYSYTRIIFDGMMFCFVLYHRQSSESRYHADNKRADFKPETVKRIERCIIYPCCVSSFRI